jgi:hypothetical protein
VLFSEGIRQRYGCGSQSVPGGVRLIGRSSKRC